MSPKRLTVAERVQVACYHSIFAKWVVDPVTGHGVCCHCGKPSPQTVLRICADCNDEFIIQFNWKWLPKYAVLSNGVVIEREFFCPPCNGDV